MKNEIYIVTAYRWGERSDHSYNLGVFTKKHKAQKVADSHRDYRGGKYACVVEKCVPDNFDNDSDIYTTEIYRAKSIKN
ncbi:MAG: hypothetical protein WD512_04305 [Candidatus Paceibacterota bacterium]